jgi:hypothetical protein
MGDAPSPTGALDAAAAKADAAAARLEDARRAPGAAGRSAVNFNTGDTLYIAPLIILAVAGILLVLAEAFYTGRDRTALAGLAVAGGVAAAVASVVLYRHLEPGRAGSCSPTC